MSISWPNYFASRASSITGSQIRQYFSLTERPEVISFAGGFPDSDIFPQEKITMTLSRMIEEEAGRAMQYGPTEGHLELRRHLAEKNSRSDKTCTVDNVIITDGSQQGLDLLCMILLDPGDPVLVEEPAYIGGMSAIKSYGGIPVGIAMDNEGPVPAAMENAILKLRKKGKSPKFFYTVPNFQNPTGLTTGLNRRREILAVASRYSMAVVEDDPYGELCYEGEVPSSYFDIDNHDRVIYLGSYSKVLIPGIRIGWMTGPEPLIEKITLAKQSSDLCSSSLGQQLAYRLSREGFIARHIEDLKYAYRKKRDAMVESMERCFPEDIVYNRPRGGFFVWVNFPGRYPASTGLLDMALRRNVAFVPGEGFSSCGTCTHSARFSFSQPGCKEIVAGVERLGRLFQEVGAEKVAGSALFNDAGI